MSHFVQKFSLAMNKRITRVSPAAMNQLQQQHWLGNVRELENAVERATVVGQEPELHEQNFIFKPASDRRLRQLGIQCGFAVKRPSIKPIWTVMNRPKATLMSPEATVRPRLKFMKRLPV